jgi:protein TonB
MVGTASGATGGLGIMKDMPGSVPKLAGQKLRVSSGVAQGQLTHQVTPQYPSQARQERVQGTVVLQAVIAKDGSVEKLSIVSGPSQLTKAAMEAVKQWRYRPFALNGEPVEADTQINVNFKLGE